MCSASWLSGSGINQPVIPTRAPEPLIWNRPSRAAAVPAQWPNGASAMPAAAPSSTTEKLQNGVGKLLLRHAVRNLLPDTVIRRSKQGFAVPTGRWFEQGLLSLSDGNSANPFWRARVDEHRGGRADHRLALWNQLVLENTGEGMR